MIKVAHQDTKKGTCDLSEFLYSKESLKGRPTHEIGSEKTTFVNASSDSHSNNNCNNNNNLTSTQKDIAELAIFGDTNMFLTGAAGVGKSFLLRYIIDSITGRTREYIKGVAVTASTGIAALHISGQTIHSFAGIGLGTGSKEYVFGRLDDVARNRWMNCNCLIIDEISMISAELFDKLDYIARRCRSCPTVSFGGIRLILSGDFFQLPPIDMIKGSGFAFQSAAWRDAAISTCELTQVIRQADADFSNLLNQIRRGVCSDEAAAILRNCHVTVKALPRDGIIPTKLYCTNRNVDLENTTMLQALQAPQHDFKCIDTWMGTVPRATRASLLGLAAQRIPEVLSLRVGAQVMYTRNANACGLVNGSRGVVTGFAHHQTGQLCPVVQFDAGLTIDVSPLPMEFKKANSGCGLRRTQLPLKLSWALTIHKSQGMTLTRVQVDAGSAFECGQVYVALSRAASMQGLYLTGKHIDQTVVRANGDVLNFYSKTGVNQ